MRPKLLLTLSICCLAFTLHAQQKRALQRHMLALTEGFRGDVGFYVKNLRNGRVVASHNADSVFPTASIIKISILAGVMQKIKLGELNYHQKLTYSDSLLYAGVDILGSFKNGESIELGKVVMLMCTMSDNTASLWLQLLAGTGTSINELMQQLGLQYTRVNGRTTGRETDRTKYGWGQTTPLEIATVFELIVKGKVVDEKHSQQMLRILSRNYWDSNALSAIPPGVFVASKNGAVDASRSEVLYVNGKRNQYIFTVFTKNNSDTGWTADNEAWRMTRSMSALIYNALN